MLTGLFSTNFSRSLSTQSKTARPGWAERPTSIVNQENVLTDLPTSQPDDVIFPVEVLSSQTTLTDQADQKTGPYVFQIKPITKKYRFGVTRDVVIVLWGFWLRAAVVELMLREDLQFRVLGSSPALPKAVHTRLAGARSAETTPKHTEERKKSPQT